MLSYAELKDEPETSTSATLSSSPTPLQTFSVFAAERKMTPGTRFRKIAINQLSAKCNLFLEKKDVEKAMRLCAKVKELSERPPQIEEYLNDNRKRLAYFLMRQGDQLNPCKENSKKETEETLSEDFKKYPFKIFEGGSRDALICYDLARQYLERISPQSTRLRTDLKNCRAKITAIREMHKRLSPDVLGNSSNYFNVVTPKLNF